MKISEDFSIEIGTIILNHKQLKKKLKSALVNEIAVLYNIYHTNICLEVKK